MWYRFWKDSEEESKTGIELAYIVWLNLAIFGFMFVYLDHHLTVLELES